jgi:hypothetical protein
MDNDNVSGLITLAWFTSIGALPIHFWAYVGWGLSVSSPNATFASLLLLAVGPVVALAALLYIVLRRKITWRRVVGMVVPTALSLAELAFTFAIWKAG